MLKRNKLASFLKSLTIVATALAATILGGIVAYHLLVNYRFSQREHISSQGNSQQIDSAPNTDDRLRSIKYLEIIELTNAYRASKKLSPLKENQLLNRSACLKADDMIVRNYWSHDAPDGSKPWKFFQESGYQYFKAGENLAYGFASDDATVEGWIQSPTHEANLVGDYRELGVCVRGPVTYQGGTYYVIVAHYGSPH